MHSMHEKMSMQITFPKEIAMAREKKIAKSKGNWATGVGREEKTM